MAATADSLFKFPWMQKTFCVYIPSCIIIGVNIQNLQLTCIVLCKLQQSWSYTHVPHWNIYWTASAINNISSRVLRSMAVFKVYGILACCGREKNQDAEQCIIFCLGTLQPARMNISFTAFKSYSRFLARPHFVHIYWHFFSYHSLSLLCLMKAEGQKFAPHMFYTWQYAYTVILYPARCSTLAQSSALWDIWKWSIKES